MNSFSKTDIELLMLGLDGGHAAVGVCRKQPEQEVDVVSALEQDVNAATW